MDYKDRTEIEEVKKEVKTLAVNFEKSCKDTKIDILDLYACNNDVAESLHEIKTNHLRHLNLKINVTLGGLAFIGIMIALLGCMIAFWKG